MDGYDCVESLGEILQVTDYPEDQSGRPAPTDDRLEDWFQGCAHALTMASCVSSAQTVGSRKMAFLDF
jgi:hypothetical protein